MFFVVTRKYLCSTARIFSERSRRRTSTLGTVYGEGAPLNHARARRRSSSAPASSASNSTSDTPSPSTMRGSSKWDVER